jgi:UDP-glucose 4-epimerase
MKQCLLITGGAGYIGSHTVRYFAERGDMDIVVVDNLDYGHKEAIIHPIVAVMHFAAYAYVGESVENPSKYYQNNVLAAYNLLEAMREAGCKQFVFSSTCATFGNPHYLPIDEQHPQQPINPYGQSKVMLEKMLADYSRAYQLRYGVLRYFNAAGASLDARIGEDHTPETHLIPLVLDAALGARPHITVFGTDYDTPDGTCIRDYIHVLDIATAHACAFDYLHRTNENFACNLGTGRGHSVKEIIDTAQRITGREIPVVYAARRAGDPPILVADATLAEKLLGWTAAYTDIAETIRTAWNWRVKGGSYKPIAEQ